MSANLLNTLQADVAAILAATPALAYAVIHLNNEGDIEARVMQSLAPIQGAASGKRGLCLVVLPPEVTKAEANLPGPPLLVKVEIQAIEYFLANRDATSGTGIYSDAACLLALSALHHQVLGTHALYAEDNPVAPTRVKPGYGSHILTVFARANGVQGPGKPAAVTFSQAAGGLPESITVSGDLTTDGTTPAVFTELPRIGELNGKPVFDDQGADAALWINGEWNLVYDPLGSLWISPDDVATPDLVTTWIPQNGATGIPVVTANGGTDQITLACATPDAAIYYTTDGTYPDATNGTLYTAPFASPDAGTIIRTAAYKTGLNPGDVTEILIE